MIEQIEISGALAFSYVREQLSAGRELSELINKLPLEEGRVFALVPPLTKPNKVFSFKCGGLYEPGEPIFSNGSMGFRVQNDARRFVSETVENYLSLDQMHCCLFEDVLAGVQDPALAKSKVGNISIGETVLYFINSINGNLESIESTITFSESFVFLCVLSSVEIEYQKLFSNKSQLSLEILDQYVKNISSFFIGAYDGEGYLMWKKQVGSDNLVFIS